jgi:hypothetical protein
MWLVSRWSNNKQIEPDYHSAQHYEPPIITRRQPEVYTPKTNTSPQVNITGELTSLNTRLISLESRMVILERLVRMTYSGMQSSTQGHQKFDESPYRLASIEPVDDYAQPLKHTDFLRAAADSYQRLTLEGLRNLAVEPVFVYLDVDESARGAAVGESERVFKQSDNKQNAFVIFAKTDGDGWLFPNPRISYTESMGYVFPQLTFENFTDSKHGVDPLRVKRTGESTWETFRQ